MRIFLSFCLSMVEYCETSSTSFSNFETVHFQPAIGVHSCVISIYLCHGSCLFIFTLFRAVISFCIIIFALLFMRRVVRERKEFLIKGKRYPECKNVFLDEKYWLENQTKSSWNCWIVASHSPRFVFLCTKVSAFILSSQISINYGASDTGCEG